MASIYKSAEGRKEILAAYDLRLAALPLAVDSLFVKSRFGATHLLIAGPADAPPLLLIHGTNGSALDLAEALGFLCARNRCFFLDVPGQPNRSSETRLDKEDDSCARWIEDVLGNLKLERAAMIGVSGGGYVALKCGAVIPERITRLALIAPQGLSRPYPLALFRAVIWPLMRYRLSPGPASVRRFVRALSAPGSPSNVAVERMALAMKHVETVFDRPALFSAQDLGRLSAPVILIAGGRDALFPANRVIEHARAVIPNLREAILLPDANHLTALFAAPAMARVAAFLAER